MIDRTRLVNHFLELVRINSLSGREREVAISLRKELEGLGAEVAIDDAGEKVGGNVGNVIAYLRGNVSAPSILLCAHMDTVAPGEGVKPIVEGDLIRSDGRTILGGDGKSGIAIICEVVRVLKERNLPHGDIEVIFTICEEMGLLGAKHLDVSRLKSRFGLVLDSGELPHLITKAPAADRMEFRVYGLEAHAGVCPERGINAIKVAGEAIAGMRLGRIDPETTANIGIIQGGLATNIIPNFVTVKGEARSHDEAKLDAQTTHMRRCFQEAAARYHLTLDQKVYEARVVEEVWRDYPRMDVPEGSRIVRLVLQAAERLGLKIKPALTGGGCDANIFNGKGMEVVNLGTGMREIHTVKEHLEIAEMLHSAEVLLEVLKLNAEVGGNLFREGQADERVEDRTVQADP